jgi:hypothetical protein
MLSSSELSMFIKLVTVYVLIYESDNKKLIEIERQLVNNTPLTAEMINILKTESNVINMFYISRYTYDNNLDDLLFRRVIQPISDRLFTISKKEMFEIFTAGMGVDIDLFYAYTDRLNEKLMSYV